MRVQNRGRGRPGPFDYTGSSGGGYPHYGEPGGDAYLPHDAGGSRHGGDVEAAREAAYYLEEPRQVRARGRMPRSYRRSDARVREDLCERLADDPRIDASDVSVAVSEGRIVLEGTVPERRMKYLIEDTAAECLGANDVDNRIRVPRRDAAPAGGTETAV